MTGRIPLTALVGPDIGEAVQAASARLSASLSGTAGAPWQVDCEPYAEAQTHPVTPSLMLVDLRSEADNLETPWPDVEAGLRARCREWTATPDRTVFLMTVFRASALDEAAGDTALRRERIRRLNLLAARLSREMGALIIDVDRTFADLGARAMGCDYRLAGERAKEALAGLIASTIAAYGLDAWVAPEAQEAAIARLAAQSPAAWAPERLSVFAAGLIPVRSGGRVQTAEVVRRDPSQLGHYIRHIMRGQMSLGEAVSQVRDAIAKRGLRYCLEMIVKGLGLMAGRKARSAS